jgi:23S rRNA pseudouridine2605 synthase
VSPPDVEGERLQKVLARAGFGSRRAAEELIAEGRVEVNGSVARLGQRVVPSKDEVKVDGSRVPLAEDLVHYLMNKPIAVITTSSDPEGRTSVLDLVDLERRVWPVGRLDYDSEGALLICNDGELTHRLTHPSFEVPKTYLAEVSGSVGRAALRTLARGVQLSDGLTRPAQVDIVERVAGGTLLQITISEGRNRQVRRMTEAVGHPTRRLVRLSVGPIRLGRLKSGRFRRLAPAEVRALYKAVGL